jgi:hypothetical protein
MKSLFPEDMLSSSGGELTIEVIAQKFSFYFEQLHLLHLQTPSYAEHQALNLWEDIVDAKDSFLEQLMGYEGRKIGSYTFLPLTNYVVGAPSRTVTELKEFTKQLESYATMKGYSNIGNMAQDLGGKCAKTLFLLTLS